MLIFVLSFASPKTLFIVNCKDLSVGCNKLQKIIPDVVCIHVRRRNKRLWRIGNKETEKDDSNFENNG